MNEQMTKILFIIDKDTQEKFKTACQKKGTKMSVVIRMAIDKFLKENQ